MLSSSRAGRRVDIVLNTEIGRQRGVPVCLRPHDCCKPHAMQQGSLPDAPSGAKRDGISGHRNSSIWTASAPLAIEDKGSRSPLPQAEGTQSLACRLEVIQTKERCRHLLSSSRLMSRAKHKCARHLMALPSQACHSPPDSDPVPPKALP